MPLLSALYVNSLCVAVVAVVFGLGLGQGGVMYQEAGSVVFTDTSFFNNTAVGITLRLPHTVVLSPCITRLP